MIKAYIMIKTEPGAQNDVYTKILKIKEIKSADIVIGPYDIIALVECKGLNSLGKMVISKIQNLAGIRDTVTCMVVEPIQSIL